MDIALNEVEARVLGCLIEKELATPEYYPLSLNALINACNQKTNRSPVLSLSEGDVVAALQSLTEKQLVGASEASRVTKYWHGIDKKFNLIRRETALLCLLLLRGPQTSGELRIRSEKLSAFANIEEVVEYLDNLAEIGLAVKLPRMPGQKEQRYVNLLTGEPAMADMEEFVVPVELAREMGKGHDRFAMLEQEIATLQEELAWLRREFIAFKEAMS